MSDIKRIVVDGTNYNIHDETARGDIAELKSAVDDLNDVIGYSASESQINIGSGQGQTYWNVETSTAVKTSLASSNWMTFTPYSVTSGQKYKVKACQGNTDKTRIWVITDDNLDIISMAQNHKGTAYATEEFTVPDGGTKLLITSTSSVSGGTSPYAFAYLISARTNTVMYTPQSLDTSEKAQARSNIDAASTSDVNTSERITSFTLAYAYFWNIETNVAVYTEISGGNWIASTVVPVNEGDVYSVSGAQGSTHKTRIWVVTDDSMNVIDMADDYYGDDNWHTETFTVPTGGTKLVMTTRYNVGSPYVYLYKHTTLKNIVQKKILDGKTVAIIGDSISTNGNTGTDPNVPELTITADDVGIELSAYLTYYDVQAGLSLGGHTYISDEIGQEVTFTPEAGDVGKSIGLPNNYNPDSTTVWWEIAQTELGFSTIPVCWSGASITSHEDSQASRKTSYAWHPAQIRKCGIRTPGTMTRTAPDMIIIYRGTNDFSHEPYTKLTDDYFDGANWEYPTDDTVTGGYGYLEGMALTIKKLREAYPNTQIYLCTLNVFKRINYSHFPTNNGLNTLPEYNNAIRKAADFFGCGLIEFDKDGITFENCYSGGYITDSATIPTHPSDKGHGVMGRRAIADIKAQYNEL